MTVRKFAEKVKESGGRAFYVGGFARDEVMGIPSKDIDIEVFGVPVDVLKKILSEFGPINMVGESFTVFKVRLGGNEVDVSLPRTEKKVGSGHKGFEVVGDPFLSTFEAARRRDFTMNALMKDVLTGEVVDHFGGRQDIVNGVIRVVDPTTFVEDSLRVLRAAQFSGRFGFTIDPATVELCRFIDLSDLPAERLREEIFKLLLKSKTPSVGIKALVELGIAEKLFPEVHALVGCPQRPDFHPEGCTFVHTCMVVDVAARLAKNLSREDKLILMLAALCHDFGKPLVTAEVGGIIRAIDHEKAGIAPTEKFLDRLGVFTENGVDVRVEVLKLVEFHLMPNSLFNSFSKGENMDNAIRRLAAKGVNMKLLARLSMADSLGRTPDAKNFGVKSEVWFRRAARRLGVAEKPLAKLVTGKDLIAMGLGPGPIFSQIINHVYSLQLDGKVSNKEEALKEARAFLNG